MTRIQRASLRRVAVSVFCILGARILIVEPSHEAWAQAPSAVVGAAAQDGIRAARQKLTDAKTDDEKQAARANLRRALAEIFAQDMQMREKQAEEIEARLAKLRQQYQAREKVKDEIIDLQLKVIEQDAAGLGFPGGQLRVPLSRRTGPMGDVFETGTAAATPFDPMAAALDPEFLKRYATQPQTRVAELAARGHFVGSPDGRLYAYVETGGDGIPEGTAEIRLCDARTGQPLAAAKIKTPVGKLRFLNEGVATEDPNGTLKLRISFTKDYDVQEVLETAVPDKAYFETAKHTGSPAVDLQRERVRLQFQALSSGNTKLESVLAACNDLAKAEGPSGRAEHLARLAELLQLGERLYQVNRATMAELLAVKGAYESARSQTLKGPDDWDLSSHVKAADENARSQAAADKATLVGVTNQSTPSHALFASEYNALRDQYRKAKADLAAAEARFNETVAEARKTRPEATVDDVRKQYPDAWRAVERARPAFEEAERLLDAKLTLLDLDLKSAEVTLAATESKLQAMTELHKKNYVTLSEVNEQRAAVDAAQLNVERAKTLIDLFKSIPSQPAPTPEKSSSAPQPEESRGTDPVALSNAARREALGMLQGTWNCVAAGSHEKQLSQGELTALALQFAINADRVTISYYGDDLQQHQTAGKLLIDTSASPPQFHIDVSVAGIQSQSRLSGITTLGRGVLRMTRPGGTFLIHCKFESEPTSFEFQRPNADSTPGAAVSILDRIKSLGLKLGNETKTSLDTRYPMRITGRDGQITIKAGETKLIQLSEPTLVMQWQCGDFQPEGIEDTALFDYVLVEWKADGHVTWTCYRSPKL